MQSMYYLAPNPIKLKSLIPIIILYAVWLLDLLGIKKYVFIDIIFSIISP